MNTLMLKKLLTRASLMMVLALALGTHAQAASIKIEPSQPLHSGDTSTLQVLLTTDKQEVNAVEGEIAIQGGYSISSLSTAGSVLTLWPNKPSLMGNKISFTGGTTAGISGSNLKLFSITLKPNSAGALHINFSNIFTYLNDGNGSRSAVAGQPTTLNVGAKQSPSHNDLLETISHDTNPPAPFEITIGHDEQSFGGKYFASFGTTDAESGINRYEVSEEGFPTVRSGSPYVLRNQSLQGNLRIQAIDNAGNIRVSSINMSAAPGTSSLWFWCALVFIALTITLVIWKKRRRLLLLTLAALLMAPTTHAASLYVSPSSNNVPVGGNVTATVYLNSEGTAINSAEGAMAISTDNLEIQSVDTSNSIFNLWVEQPRISNGVITFSGGVPNPGYSGLAGKLFSINLRAKKFGTGEIRFQSTAIRANDGLGSDVAKPQSNSLATSINISNPAPVVNIPTPPSLPLPSAPEISSKQTPDSNQWYALDESTFSWKLPSSVESVALLLSESATEVPSVVYNPAISSKTISNLEEGVWYLHARYRNAAGWGPTTHYAVRIDRTAPSTPQITSKLTSGDTSISLSAQDQLSGIAKYSVSVDSGAPQEIVAGTGEQTIYNLDRELSGKHLILARAIDRAGNVSAEASIGIDLPAAPTTAPVTEQTSPSLSQLFEALGTRMVGALSLLLPILALIIVLALMIEATTRKLKARSARNVSSSKMASEALESKIKKHLQALARAARVRDLSAEEKKIMQDFAEQPQSAKKLAVTRRKKGSKNKTK